MNQERNRKNLAGRFFSSRIFLTVLGVSILTLLSFPLAKNLSQRHRIDEEVEKMREEISRIEEKNSGLKELASYLESDQFIEGEARLKLSLKKNGEEVIGIKSSVPETEKEKEPGSVYNMPGLNNLPPEKPKTNPEKWFKYFFKK
ncbi:MAG: septum formation initiator family protein [Patescibacteria group bacterium]|jgi:cell division protein FtsB